MILILLARYWKAITRAWYWLPEVLRMILLFFTGLMIAIPILFTWMHYMMRYLQWLKT